MDSTTIPPFEQATHYAALEAMTRHDSVRLTLADVLHVFFS